MEMFLQDLYSSHFWLSVIFIGLLINLITPLFQILLSIPQKYYASISKSFKLKLDAKKSITEEYIQAIASNDLLRMEAEHQEIRLRFAALWNLLYSFFFVFLSYSIIWMMSSKRTDISSIFIVVVNTVLLIAVVHSQYSMIKSHLKALRISRCLRKARDIRFSELPPHHYLP